MGSCTGGYISKKIWLNYGDGNPPIYGQCQSNPDTANVQAQCEGWGQTGYSVRYETARLLDNATCVCPAKNGAGDNLFWDVDLKLCVTFYKKVTFDPPTCSAAGGANGASDGATTGNPIIPASGEKQLYETDSADNTPHGLSLRRIYRSQISEPAFAMGGNWLPTLGAWLTVTASTTVTTTASITLGDGKVRRFTKALGASAWTSDTIATDTLSDTASGFDYRSTDDSVRRFNTAGKLLTHTQRNGWVTSYTYFATGQLSQITNQFGRSLLLAYNASGQINQVTQPDGKVLRYDYVTGADNVARLSKVTYPDNTFKTYLYENAAFPNALTGVTDENNIRLATYTYDTQGRAIDTVHAGGANRFQVSYPATAGAATQVTDPLGTARSYNYSTSLGQLAVTGADKPSGQSKTPAAW
jgi:YD repeat-containing protein